MEDIKVTIGKNIRIFRKQKGYTLQSLSKQIGITHQQLSRIENGMGTSTHTLERIAAVLDVDMKELMEEPEINLKNSIPHIKNFVPTEIYNKLCSEMHGNIIKPINDVVIEKYKDKIHKLLEDKDKICKLIDINIENMDTNLKRNYQKNNQFTFTKRQLVIFCIDLLIKFDLEISKLSKIDNDNEDKLF